MKSAAFNKLIADVYTKPLKTVTVYARLLKEAGLLTTGARGRNAPDMIALDASRMTLAILTTDSPSQCVERVRRFGRIKYSPDFKKSIRSYEAMQPDQFSKLFQDEALEDVLAYIFSLPAILGTSESCEWFNQNNFHLRVFDFEVLAELFKWKMEGREHVGEIVVPFQGEVMVQTAEGFKHVEGFTPTKGFVRTERSISCLTFWGVGVGLLTDDRMKEEQT